MDFEIQRKYWKTDETRAIMNHKNHLRLYEGNQKYLMESNAALRNRLAKEGQQPYAIVI